MFDFFLKGGPVMWPLLITSLITLSVVIERILFLLREGKLKQPELVDNMLSLVEKGDIEQAIRLGRESKDFVVITLVYGMEHRQRGLTNALLQAANRELKRFSQGLPILDTVITLAPLLGLLGTVTGMIHAFGLLGSRELEAPAVITGGIAQALIATACGLAIAIVALIPFNYLNARLEEARHDIEDATTHLERLLKDG
ncbi:MAG: MotA/TolQ/ExbB proton channel family protein [Candidatus Omnitrophota bacterium]